MAQAWCWRADAPKGMADTRDPRRSGVLKRRVQGVVVTGVQEGLGSAGARMNSPCRIETISRRIRSAS